MKATFQVCAILGLALVGTALSVPPTKSGFYSFLHQQQKERVQQKPERQQVPSMIEPADGRAPTVALDNGEEKGAGKKQQGQPLQYHKRFKTH